MLLPLLIYVGMSGRGKCSLQCVCCWGQGKELEKGAVEGLQRGCAFPGSFVCYCKWQLWWQKYLTVCYGKILDYLFVAGLLHWAEAFTTIVLDVRKFWQWEANWMRGIVSDLLDTHVICKILFLFSNVIFIQVGAILWRCCCRQVFCFYVYCLLWISQYSMGQVVFCFFGIRKLWSSLPKVTQLVRSKAGLKPVSSLPAQCFPCTSRSPW